MVKAVLFDLDNTLIDRDGAVAGLTARYPDQESFARALAAQLQPNPRLLASLRSLAGRLPLALISDGGSYTQRLKLRASKLDQVFAPQRIFISAEVGLSKPDPEFFRHAARALGVDPRDCLHFGDREELDGIGARAAGMRFRLVTRPLQQVLL